MYRLAWLRWLVALIVAARVGEWAGVGILGVMSVFFFSEVARGSFPQEIAIRLKPAYGVVYRLEEIGLRPRNNC